MVPFGIRNLLVPKSSVKYQPLTSAGVPAGLNNSIVSVGGGVSVRVSASLITTGTMAGGAGSITPGEPLSWPLARQLVFESHASGLAISFTTTSEKPRPSVIGYQELL